jgi:hypothetical protein
MPIKLDGEKIVVTEGEQSYELERVKSYGYRDLSQETTQPPTITPITSVEDIKPEILTYTHDGSANNQTEYNVNFPENTICDILVVGGGGGGGSDRAGGGGAGACIVYPNFTMNGNYKIKVGNGGLGGISTLSGGINGYDSEITNYDESTIIFRAKGGGNGSSIGITDVPRPGGCGGGSRSQTIELGGITVNSNIVNEIQTGPNITSTYAVYGNIGGRNSTTYTGSQNDMDGAGGGGIGEGGSTSGSLVAVDSQYIANNPGKGGDGLHTSTINNVNYNFKNYFNTGVLEDDEYYYIGGGGGGGDNYVGVGGNGGRGGGGNGGDSGGLTSGNGINNTGGGGGGGAGVSNNNGGNGGSGIVIIKIHRDITHKKVVLKYDYYEDKKYPTISADATNLKVWYKFDGNGDDSNPSETKYDLTNNGVSFVDGIVNQAASFDNNADLLTSSTYNLSNVLGTEFTFSLWIKVKSGISAYGQVFQFYQDGNNNIYMRRQNANYLIFWIWQNGAYIGSTLSSSNYTLDQWRLYTITFNSTEAKLYINGLLHQTISTNGDTLSIGNGYLLIGDRTNSDQHFWGEIEDFRMYNKALSTEEINDIYKQYIIPWFKNPSNSSAIAASKNWKLISYEPSEDNWFPDGLLNDIPSDRYLAFIYEDSGTLTWVMLQKSVIEGNHNWSTYSVPTGHGSISSIGRYNDELETGSQAPIITTTTNVQSSSHFIYREESSSTWHSTPPANRRYYVLEEVIQTEYTITFPTPRLCDILIVGGGGGGSEAHGGGGGAGSVIFLKDVNMNGNYTIKVGRGGGVSENIGNDGIGFKGIDSEIYKSNSNKVIAEGGGAGGAFANGNGGDGGSGGGGDGYIPTYSSGTFYPSGGSANVYTPVLEGITGVKYGNVGGSGFNQNAGTGGGGGGAGAAGESATAINDNSVYGGVGIYKATISGVDYNFKKLFGLPNDNSIGEYHPGGAYAGSTYDAGIYFGGGGGGALWENPEPNPSNVVGGLGGGGTSGGYTPTIDAENGLNNTGGGGGGGGSGGGDGGAGGSGIVIIRFRSYGIKYDAQWKHHKKLPNVHFYGNVGIGTYANHNKLFVNGNINITGDYYKNNRTLTEWYNSTNSNIYKNYGNVGIGTATPNYKLHVEGQLYAAQGGTSGTGNTSWTTTSDMHVKTNITKASYVKCYNNVNNIELYRFNYKSVLNNTRDNNQLGFIAQEVEEIFPKSVKKNKMMLNNQEEEILALDVTQINYTLFGAVKYLAEKVEALKQKVNNIN